MILLCSRLLCNNTSLLGQSEEEKDAAKRREEKLKQDIQRLTDELAVLKQQSARNKLMREVMLTHEKWRAGNLYRSNFYGLSCAVSYPRVLHEQSATRLCSESSRFPSRKISLVYASVSGAMVDSSAVCRSLRRADRDRHL